MMKPKNIKIQELLALGLVTLAMSGTSFAQAGGGHVGGGDPLALEFKKSAAIGIDEAINRTSILPSLKGINLNQILDKTDVLVSEDPLYAIKGNVRQMSTAINTHQTSAPDVLILNRGQWKAIQSEDVKTALALHEVLSLAGIENTGNYRFSQKILKSHGVKNAGLVLARAQLSQEEAQLESLYKLLNGKTLSCEPLKKTELTTKDLAYRGDYGYFKIQSNIENLITDNGDSGYGFSNSNVNGLQILNDTVLILDAGDDGHQTLLFDFFAIQDAQDPCADGSITDAADTGIGYDDSFMVKCCLR